MSILCGYDNLWSGEGTDFLLLTHVLLRVTDVERHVAASYSAPYCIYGILNYINTFHSLEEAGMQVKEKGNKLT